MEGISLLKPHLVQLHIDHADSRISLSVDTKAHYQALSEWLYPVIQNIAFDSDSLVLGIVARQHLDAPNNAQSVG